MGAAPKDVSKSISSSGRESLLLGALVVAGYLALTLLLTSPLASNITTHHAGEGGGDAPVYVWNMWWVKKALLELHQTPLQTDFIFHPVGIGLGLHTLGLMQGLLFIPLQLLMGTVRAVNVVVLSTFVFSALATYALARQCGAHRPGAFLAGTIYAFCPYRLAHLAGHYDLLSTEWIPLFLLFFMKALEHKGAWTVSLILAALSAAACGYANLTYLVFLAFLIMVFLVHRIACRLDAAWTMLGRTALVASMAAVLLLPLLVSIARDLSRWTYTSYPGAEQYSADLASYLLPGPKQSLLGGALGVAFDRNVTESIVFAGYLPLLLAAVVLLRRELRQSQTLWIAVGATFFVLSLGPALRAAGHATHVPLPFALIERLPLLHNLRAPARLSLLVVLALAMMSAAAWSSLVGRMRGHGARIAASCAATLAIAAELTAVPIPLFPAEVPALYRTIAAEPGDFAVVEIPGIDQAPGELMHHQTVHGKRIFIGFCARVPIEKQSYHFGLPLVRTLVDLRKRKITLEEALGRQERESAPRVARFLGIRYFVIDRSFAKRGLVDYLERVLPIERLAGDNDRHLLRVREDELPPLPDTLSAHAAESRMYFESGWERPQEVEGRLCRQARGRRSTVLLRRPASGSIDFDIEIDVNSSRPLEVEILLDDRRLTRLQLPAEWSTPRIALPASGRRFAERITLLWGQGAASAAVREIRLKPRRPESSPTPAV